MGRLAWVLIGALSFYALHPNQVRSYPEVIVPAARIIEREVPSGPPKIILKIKYVYLQPDVRAVAPGAVTGDVAHFCRPVMLSAVDTVRVPAPYVIRSVAYNPSLVPLRKGGLLVTSMNGYGDLVAEDFRVRPGFGIRAGLEPPYQSTVRYPRYAPLLEVGEGFLWYVGFRLVEAMAH